MAYEDALYRNIEIKPATGSGIVVPITDFSYAIASGTERVPAIGSRTPIGVYASSVKFSGSFSAIVVPGIFSILSLINSEAGKELTTFEINDGKEKLTSCKLSSLKVNFSVGKHITADFSFVSLGKTSGTSVTPFSGDTFFVAQDVTLTGIADYDCEEISISVTNGLKESYGMKGTDRTPKAISEDKQEIDIDVKFIEDHLVDVSADELAVISSGSISVMGSDGTTTFTINFVDLLAGDADKDIKLGDIVRFGLKYIAKSISFGTSE